MSHRTCRDCGRCTQSPAGYLIGTPFRLVGGITGGLTVNLFKRRCHECGHLMQYHKMVSVGANGEKVFQD